MIQATPFCNFNCSYCYLPNRSDKRKLDQDLLTPLISKLGEAGLLGDDVSIVWHAGEPLVLPLGYYESAFELIAELVSSETRITHHFQTNGSLVTQAHCDFIKKHGVRVSVSIDGPARFHDAKRQNLGGRGTHRAAVAAIKLLQKNGIDFSVINVLTAEALEAPDEIYDFYAALGVTGVGFNVEEVEGYNTSSSLSVAQESAYRRFMLRMLERFSADGNLPGFREFRSAYHPSHVFERPERHSSSENNPFSILSMDVSGNLYTFSPELVDLTSATGENYSIGNVREIDFRTIYQQEKFRRLYEPVLEGVRMCEETCPYFFMCGGGAPVNKLSEKGTFAATETVFCRYTRQLLLDVVDEFTISKLGSARDHRVTSRARNSAKSETLAV